MNGGTPTSSAPTRPAGSLSVLVLNWRDVAHPEGGGSELFAERLTAGLVQLGHDVTVFAAAYAGAESEEMRSDGVRMVRRGGHRSVYLQAWWAFRRGRLGRPDVILEVHNGVPFLARLWSGRIPVVVLVHHVHREQWRVIFGPIRSRVGWFLESRIAPVVNRGAPYVAVSDSTRAELVQLGVAASNIEVIYNGTDLPPTTAVQKSSEPTLLVIGRLVPHKRVEIALETLAELAEAFPTLTLTIAGRGWWEPQLRLRTDELGVADRVTFAGFVPPTERHRLYGSSWVSLVPSVKEGWGLVVVEAGVHGTPSVAFQGAGGVTDSIIDGETGLLVAADDSSAFRAAVRTLLVDAEFRRTLGAGASAHARSFDWDTTAKAFDRVLGDAVQRSSTRRAR